MRRKDKDVKDQKLIENILESAHICRIAFAKNNIPYIVPVNYGYNNNQIYIHSAKKGKKIDLLKMNPIICFEIESEHEIVTGEKACDWTTKYRSIIGYGKIEILDNIESKRQGLDIIMKQHGKHDNLDYKVALLNRMYILRITISELTAKQSGDWNEIVSDS